MRPLLAALLVAGIMSLVQGYMVFQRTAPRAPRPPRPPPRAASGQLVVEATLTFDAAPDDFSIQPASLLISRGEDELLRIERPLAAGESVRAEAPLTVGVNSLYLRAWPADDSPRELAVRLRVLRDEQPLLERTLWSRPGEPVEDEIRVTIPDEPARQHDHP